MDLFCVNDLYELRDFKKVCMCILSVGRYSAKVDEFEGPYFIGGKITYNREGEVENVVINTSVDNPICPTCGKPVLFTERLTALGQVYHKLCFKCTDCKRSIPQGEQYERDDMPYCKACYARLPAFKLEKA